MGTSALPGSGARRRIGRGGFYEVAARYDDESEAALQAVIGSETEEADAMSEGEKRAQAVTDFLTSLQAQREALGIPPAAPPQEFSDEYWDNLFYEAKTERLAERDSGDGYENAIVVDKNIWLDFYLLTSGPS